MAKSKTAFVCQSCGAVHSKWLGRCTSCGEWNTITEEIRAGGQEFQIRGGRGPGMMVKGLAVPIDQVERKAEHRLKTGDGELDRVLGGGIVPGSLVLLGGEPGMGKSTLMLQLALGLTGVRVLYVSGEESPHQIRMRAERLQKDGAGCFILSETSVSAIFDQISRVQPQLVIVDSIQTVYMDSLESAAGSVSQIRECATEFMRYAKSEDVPVLLIGHITKEGILAGPKVLEHMVDVVLNFEGDRHHLFRILRAQKNRFGSTSEIGIYEMTSSGLSAVSNPSEVLLSAERHSLSGNAVCMTLEGVRPLAVEVQALVSSAVYGTPQRSATGFDVRRLNMLLAVLEKRCGFRLGQKDVFMNIAGGIKVEDPALDAAVVASILSSNEDVALSPALCLAAEVGLSGEVRPVSRIDTRIAEAERLGFRQIVVSKFSKLNHKTDHIQIVKVGRVDELYEQLF